MDLTPLFAPRTLAVIGVSLTNDLHPATVIYNRNYLRNPVKVYPVNPKGGWLQGDPVYPQVKDIPEPVDLAVIGVRAEYVPQVLKACIEAGAGGAVVISGGFAEVGRPELQQQAVDLARAADFPFIGPNCIGIYVPFKFDTFFLPPERLVRPEPGNVALISQSGGVLVDQMVKYAGQGIGLSKAVSIGNKALIRETDLLAYFAQDPATEVIAFYIEGFERGEGRRFVQTARNCQKPVVVLKAGKSDQGMRAASSHTASLAGDHRVFSAVLAQHGIAEARSEFELLAFSESLSCSTQSISGEVAILTVSGGHGVLAADACDRQGLRVPSLSPQLQQQIREALSPSVQGIAGLGNPLDLTGSARDDDFIAAAKALSHSSEIDSVLLLVLPYSPAITTDIGARMARIFRETDKALAAYVPHEPK
ncbi:MAG: CoA-binding protein, partial [Desulfobacterales bacterium]